MVCLCFYLCEGIKKKRIWKRKTFFLLPNQRLTSHEPWSHRQCQSNSKANHTKDGSILFAPLQVVFRKTGAFLQVLSDLFQTSASHEVHCRKYKDVFGFGCWGVRNRCWSLWLPSSRIGQHFKLYGRRINSFPFWKWSFLLPLLHVHYNIFIMYCFIFVIATKLTTYDYKWQYHWLVSVCLLFVHSSFHSPILNTALRREWLPLWWLCRCCQSRRGWRSTPACYPPPQTQHTPTPETAQHQTVSITQCVFVCVLPLA